MPDYRIELEAISNMKAAVFLTAKNEAAARIEALIQAFSGEVHWYSESPDKATVGLTEIREV